MIIRRATLDDSSALIVLAKAMFLESRYAELTTWDTQKASRSIVNVLLYPRTVVFVAEADNLIVGFLQAGLIEYAYSEDVYAKAEHLYVLPPYRGGSGAPRLIEAYERWADGIGATEKLLGITTGVHVEAFGRFAQKQSYVPCGWVYTKGAGNV